MAGPCRPRHPCCLCHGNHYHGCQRAPQRCEPGESYLVSASSTHPVHPAHPASTVCHSRMVNGTTNQHSVCTASTPQLVTAVREHLRTPPLTARRLSRVNQSVLPLAGHTTWSIARPCCRHGIQAVARCRPHTHPPSSSRRCLKQLFWMCGPPEFEAAAAILHQAHLGWYRTCQ